MDSRTEIKRIDCSGPTNQLNLVSRQVTDMNDNNIDENIENDASHEINICNENVREQENIAVMPSTEVVTDVKVHEVINNDNNTSLQTANNTKHEENGTEKEINTNAGQCENKIDENHTITCERTPENKPREECDSDKDEIQVDVDTTMGCKDVTENLGGDDEKSLKRYRLRQRQSKSYTDEKPPSKKKKINNKDVETKVDLTCYECYVSFETKVGYSIHMNRHNQPEIFTCAQCSMEFLTNKELKDHKKVHDGEDCIFICEQCEVAYSSNMEYLLHKAEHKTKDFKCEECGKMCKRNRGLEYRDHLFTHFNDTHKCDVCQKVIKNRYSYLQHLQSHEATYSKKTSFVCGECGKDCKTKKHYDYHMSTHTGVKIYQCLYCGKGFGNMSQRVVHTRIHSNERPFKCTMCNESFKQSTNLKRHIVTKHNSEKFECKFCKKQYKQKRILDLHMRIHTKKNLISCPVCDEKFTEKASMKSHYVYRHMDEKPFKCDVCNKTFKLVGGLRKHLRSRIHTNISYGVEFKKKKLEEMN